jgi:hypothetical protein
MESIMTKVRLAVLARFPNLKAQQNGQDVSEEFMKYLVDDNIASCTEEEKVELIDALSNTITERDIASYASDFIEKKVYEGTAEYSISC